MVYHPHVFPLFGQVQCCLSLTHTHTGQENNTNTIWQVLHNKLNCTFMFCESTLALASSSRLITVVFPARTAQCSAVFLWYLSPRFTETLNVNNKRVGSTLKTKNTCHCSKRALKWKQQARLDEHRHTHTLVHLCVRYAAHIRGVIPFWSIISTSCKETYLCKTMKMCLGCNFLDFFQGFFPISP